MNRKAVIWLNKLFWKIPRSIKSHNLFANSNKIHDNLKHFDWANNQVLVKMYIVNQPHHDYS